MGGELRRVVFKQHGRERHVDWVHMNIYCPKCHICSVWKELSEEYLTEYRTPTHICVSCGHVFQYEDEGLAPTLNPASLLHQAYTQIKDGGHKYENRDNDKGS